MDRNSNISATRELKFSEFVKKFYPMIDIHPYLLDMFESYTKNKSVVVSWPKVCGKVQIQNIYKEYINEHLRSI